MGINNDLVFRFQILRILRSSSHKLSLCEDQTNLAKKVKNVVNSEVLSFVN